MILGTHVGLVISCDGKLQLRYGKICCQNNTIAAQVFACIHAWTSTVGNLQMSTEFQARHCCLSGRSDLDEAAFSRVLQSLILASHSHNFDFSKH